MKRKGYRVKEKKTKSKGQVCKVKGNVKNIGYAFKCDKGNQGWLKEDITKNLQKEGDSLNGERGETNKERCRIT